MNISDFLRMQKQILEDEEAEQRAKEERYKEEEMEARRKRAQPVLDELDEVLHPFCAVSDNDYWPLTVNLPSCQPIHVGIHDDETEYLTNGDTFTEFRYAYASASAGTEYVTPDISQYDNLSGQEFLELAKEWKKQRDTIQAERNAWIQAELERSQRERSDKAMTYIPKPLHEFCRTAQNSEYPVFIDIPLYSAIGVRFADYNEEAGVQYVISATGRVTTDPVEAVLNAQNRI